MACIPASRRPGEDLPPSESMPLTTHRLVNGDARDLSFLGDESVHLIVTSPLRTGRNSVGVDIDPEYCRMAARYLKAETSGLFLAAKLLFEKVNSRQTTVVMEDQGLYEVKPAKRKLT
jgi:hypothetical protein